MDIRANQRKRSTLEQIEDWIEVAGKLGYRVRYDDFGAGGGGICEFAGQKWIFIDVSLSAWEQLSMLEESIPKDPIYSSMKQNEQSSTQRAA